MVFCFCFFFKCKTGFTSRECLPKQAHLSECFQLPFKFNTSRFGKRARFAHWAFLEHHKINQYMAFRLILTEGGQRTHWEVWKPLTLASGLRISIGDLTTFTTLSLWGHNTIHSSHECLIWITVLVTVIYYPRQRRQRLSSMWSVLIPHRVYLAYMIIICEDLHMIVRCC